MNKQGEIMRRKNKQNKMYNTLSICLSILLFLLTIQPATAWESYFYTVDRTSIDTAQDFDNFLNRCSLEERISLIQSLHRAKMKIKDEYFGQLKDLYPLYYYATNKKEASQDRPLKPRDFNEVSAETVADAVSKGYLKDEDFSCEAVKKALIWRRYNKVNYLFHEKKNIDYHKDIVLWVAKKMDIENSSYYSTYELERKIGYKLFEAIWDKLSPEQREKLLTKIEGTTDSKIENKAAIALQGGAAAIAALSTTVAFTGFAFYTTMSTVMCTVAGYFGATLPFAAYSGLASTVAVLSGPIGWCLAGMALAGSAFLMGMNEPNLVAGFIYTVNAIKTKWNS